MIIVVTDTGCEEACKLEIQRWTKAKCQVLSHVVLVDGTLEDAVNLGYHLQTARRVLVEVTPKLKNLEELKSRKPDLSLFAENLTFKAEGDVLTEQPDIENPSAQQLVEDVGEWMASYRKVQLKHPDLTLYAVQTSDGLLIGLDIMGRPLAKREYRIMLGRRSIKATIAAATAIYAGVKDDELILDPVAGDGSIAIEAALLLTRTSPWHFTKHFAFQKMGLERPKDHKTEIGKIMAFASNLQEMKAMRTNSKLAGVEKSIHSTKVSVDWLELKVEEASVDRIITSPIISGKSLAQSQVEKINDELFYQAEYVLKKGKTITCITDKPDELLPAATKYDFEKTLEKVVFMGRRRMTILSFKKVKK
jgi:23S rRNA G2445 N2-methylase RlmL